jgi:uncharacterized protein YebE (UPF0316 family)
MLVEEKLAIGTLVVRVILPRDGTSLVNCLRTEGYGATYVDGQGANGQVILIYTVVMRKELSRVVDLIQECHPKAFFTVEELRSAEQGIFPVRSSSPWDKFLSRKAK